MYNCYHCFVLLTDLFSIYCNKWTCSWCLKCILIKINSSQWTNILPWTTAKPIMLLSLCVGFHSYPVKDSTDSQLSFVLVTGHSGLHLLFDFFLLELWKPPLHWQRNVRWLCSSRMIQSCVFLYPRWMCRQLEVAQGCLVSVSILARWRWEGGEVWGNSGNF